MFLIESQVGEPLDRKMIRRDIHSIFEMNLFEDVTVEVEPQDEDKSGFKGYLLRFLVIERPRLAEIKFKGILMLERTEIEYKMTLVQYDPYDPEKINVNKQIILEYYRSEGYPRVKVNSIIETIDSQAKNEGKKFRVIFEIEEKRSNSKRISSSSEYVKPKSSSSVWPGHNSAVGFRPIISIGTSRTLANSNTCDL